ncbi:uncharacterized protein [Nicotiana sylvestris]|uniref:uncharacterized protein n=1 Tax=Nicotiana sylvestris TaxID=4096 RepID=UPI00388C50BF
MADKTMKMPLGIIDGVLVRVDKFILPANFVILDCEVDYEVPIILGRLFLATGKALVDVEAGELTFKVGDEKVVFHVCKSMSQPNSIVVCSFVDLVTEVIVDDTSAMINVEDPIEAMLLNLDVNEDEGRVKCVTLHGMGSYYYEPQKLSLDLENRKTLPTKPSIEEPPVDATLAVLQKRKKAIRWTLTDIWGISPAFCMHKIILEDDAKPSVEHRRKLNEAMQEVVKKELIKWLDAWVMYPISDSSWTSSAQCVPNKGGMTVVANAQNKLIPTRIVTGWRVCMDYRKLNKVTCKDPFSLPFLDQMLDRLVGHAFYCFLDGYSGYNQTLITPEYQEKATFTCLYGTFAFSKMPFGLCNAPATFQRCMMTIFTTMVEDILEVFMDDFSVVGDLFDECLKNLDKVLTRMPWFADVANFLVTSIVPCELSSNQRKKLKQDRLDYYWDEPYMFKICNDGMIRRCVSEEEQMSILDACHSSPYGGHHGGAKTASKVPSCGFYWPTLYKYVSDLVKKCDEYQRAGGILKKDEMPLTTILEDKMKYLHDKYACGKEFELGDFVLLFNSRLRLFMGKLKSKWNGPFEVVLVTPFGALDLKNKNGEIFRVNGNKVKHYLGFVFGLTGCEICIGMFDAVQDSTWKIWHSLKFGLLSCSIFCGHDGLTAEAEIDQVLALIIFN